MRKSKLIAPFVTLLSAFIALMFMIYWGYNLSNIARVLLVIIIIFYVLGAFIQKKIMKFIDDNEEKAKEEAEKEGAVIEKEIPDTEESEGEEEYKLPPLTGAMPNFEGETSPENMFRTPENR